MTDQDRSFNTFMYQHFLMPSKFRIIFATILNLSITIGSLLCIALFYILPNRISDEGLIYGIFGAYLLVIAIIEITILKYRFPSLGHLILGLTYVNGLSGRRLERIDFISLWYESFLLSFKYAGLYTTYSFFTSEYNQPLAFEENNVYIVKYWKYRSMVNNKILIVEK